MKGRSWLVLAAAALILFLVAGRSGDKKPDPRPSVIPAQETEEETETMEETEAVRTERDWGKLMALPDREEIRAWNAQATMRSPYLCGWIDTDGVDGFADWFVDFRAEYLPVATYCCLANFDLDYSALTKTYDRVWLDYEGVAGYAGFQRTQDGRYKAIMSLWDVHCADASGAETVIRAKLTYPGDRTEVPFSGEGTGAQYLTNYDWQAGKWYRMVLHCGVSETTGNTTLTMWAIDLETGRDTVLCTYDLGVPDVCFRGSVAVFLEDFDPKTAGEVRSMEVRNVVINDRDGFSHRLTKAYLAENYEYPGSYRYGVDGDTFWFVTTGVPGKADPLQEAAWMEVVPVE